MYCPSCGKQIPDGSQFCMHCGKSIASPTQSAVPAPVSTPPKPIEWEYEDFVLTWPQGSRPYRGAISIVYTRYDIWTEQQKWIRPQIQKWLDEGWEAITEIGPAGFEWRSYKKVEFGEDATGCLIQILIFFVTASLWLWVWIFLKLTNPTSYEEVTAFRVKMRRQKRSQQRATNNTSKSIPSELQAQKSSLNSSRTLQGVVNRERTIITKRPHEQDISYILGAKMQGQTLAILGRTSDNKWVQVYFVGEPEAWVETSHLNIDGDLSKIPVTSE